MTVCAVEEPSKMATEDGLTRRTSFAQYEADLLPKLSGEPAKRWTAMQAAVAAEMVDGDELWEWESAEFMNLAGTAGLAVVRDGRIVRRWPLWKS
jgi:hypothetical protein